MPQAPSQAFALTKDNLGPVLTNMGLRPERVNEKRYRIQIERGDRMFTISTSISNDGTEVWLNTYGAEIADIAALPPTVMDKLIKASNDYGLSHFIFIAGGKRGTKPVPAPRAG